mmetsp:Transcript_6909/g.5151  ORF Transcript_6909/g.5151 Transcript_6909/m.5151 type:complete len:85 (+) Transcript_6909:295-549(+)
MNILKSGFLFTASEFSNHIIYRFSSLGDDEPNPVICHSAPVLPHSQAPFFNPRVAQNLQVADELQNLASINDMKVQNLTGEPSP